MTYTVTIPIEIINATHRGGYWELYLKHVQSGMESRTAFEQVENDLRRYGLPGRFNSYYTFRKSLWRMKQELKAYRHKSIDVF